MIRATKRRHSFGGYENQDHKHEEDAGRHGDQRGREKDTTNTLHFGSKGKEGLERQKPGPPNKDKAYFEVEGEKLIKIPPIPKSGHASTIV